LHDVEHGWKAQSIVKSDECINYHFIGVCLLAKDFSGQGKIYKKQT